MSINLDEWKDYAKSHKYVNCAKYNHKIYPGLTLMGVNGVINQGSVVAEDIPYIRSIVGLNDSVSQDHIKNFAISPRSSCVQSHPKVSS